VEIYDCQAGPLLVLGKEGHQLRLGVAVGRLEVHLGAVGSATTAAATSASATAAAAAEHGAENVLETAAASTTAASRRSAPWRATTASSAAAAAAGREVAQAVHVRHRLLVVSLAFAPLFSVSRVFSTCMARRESAVHFERRQTVLYGEDTLFVETRPLFGTAGGKNKK
jgi:hypothetical protein